MVGQPEIVEVLKARRLAGDEAYFKPRQVRKLLMQAGYDASQCDINLSFKLSQLARFCVLERILPSIYNELDRREWRIAYRYRIPMPSVKRKW